MKPEDLKYPFSWSNRSILIQDRIWYMPDHYHQYEAFTFPGWSHPEIFGNENAIRVEYCSGNGSWIAQKAASIPGYNWVAVEKKFMRVRKIWSKIKNGHHRNLFAVCGEAYHVTSRYFPSESVSDVYINFPDPWPKKRHAKHRLMQPAFVNELHRILKTGGSIHLVTDDPEYSKNALEELHAHTGFMSYYPDPFFTTDLVDYGSSYFETLWRGKGREIRYHQFEKRLDRT